jgi:hypothetical protein
MTLYCGRNIALGLVLTALLSACMQNTASNPQQAQYLTTLRACPAETHPVSAPVGMGGYRCALN